MSDTRNINWKWVFNPILAGSLADPGADGGGGNSKRAGKNGANYVSEDGLTSLNPKRCFTLICEMSVF